MTPLLALIGSLSAQAGIHPDELVLKPKIDAAIEKGVDALLDAQLRDGSWGVHGNFIGGRAGLCVYTLLRSGVPLEHPAVRRAFAYLESVEPMHTYAITCVMLAYSATGMKEHRARIGILLERLLEIQQKSGAFSYQKGNGAADLSNMQYAALGLWVADKAGFKVPAEALTNLINITLQHREEPREVDITVGVKGRTGATRTYVAGFAYRKLGRYAPKGGGHGAKPTGSMTSAGIAILKICELALGKRMNKALRQRVAQGIEGGMNWLHENYSVNHNPGAKNSWHRYYLYGLERVGALTRQEQIGDRFWYVDGAQHLLASQKNGRWGSEVDTCFALLFLRRATKISGAVTGGPGGGTKHVFVAGGPKDDIEFRGAGQQPLALWIHAFGKALLAEHSTYGLRILRVEYYEGDHKLGHLAGDPTKAWANDAYVHRVPALSRGPHTIKARVIALAPDAPNGDAERTVDIDSKPLEVHIRDVMVPWMEGVASMRSVSLLKGVKFTATASSKPKDAAKAFDNLDGTHWVAEMNDPQPTLTVELDDPIKARRVMFTQPMTSDAERGKFGTITAVEVAFGNLRNWIRIDANADPLAMTEFELPKQTVVRRFAVRIVGRTGANKPVGFAEFVLAGRAPKSKR